MTNLLISTPTYLLRYNSKTRETFVIEKNRGEYFGISWFSDEKDLYLSHSSTDHEFISTFADYAMSETGYVSCQSNESWRFLSAPHQILCLGDYILATNTGRNSLSVINKSDWSAKQYHYGQTKWDRYGADRPVGNHLNSVTYDGQYVYILASNFDRKSFIMKIDPIDFRKVDTIQCSSSYMHNIWVQDSKNIVSCDTINQGLINVSQNVMLWKCIDPDVLTRGLAATYSEVYVGVSLKSGRRVRSTGETGIWVLSSGTYETKDYHSIGNFGVVHDIRVIGEPDLCHANGVMPLHKDIMGEPALLYLSRNKIDILMSRKEALNFWSVEEGRLEVANSKAIYSAGSSLCLALVPEVSVLDSCIKATLDVSKPEADSVAIVARYSGPGDTNMVIAMLQKHTAIEYRLSLWQHSGDQWTELCGVAVYVPMIAVEFVVYKNELKLLVDEEILLNTICESNITGPGRVGIRSLRGSMSNFHLRNLDQDLDLDR